MKRLLQPAFLLGLAALTAAASAQTPFADPNPGETDRQTFKRILVDNPGGPFVDPNPGEGISATLKRILLKPGPVAGKTAGTFAAGNDARITGADRSEAFAHFYTAGGTGTEASPYTSADGTGGIQAAHDALARGGCITLAAGRFAVSTAPLITTPCTHLRGLAMGDNVDPNGESEGVHGTKIRTAGNGIVVGAPAGYNSRVGGVIIDTLYVWGPGKGGYGSTAAVKFTATNGYQQPRLTDITAANLGAAMATTCPLDTPYISRITALHCSFGLVAVAGTWFYGHITDCCLSDLDNAGVFDGLGLGGNYYHGLTLVRCAGTGDSAMIIRSSDNHIEGCVVSQPGIIYLGGHRTSGADGIVLGGPRNTVTNCTIESTLYGVGIHLYSGANNCLISGNKYAGNTGGDITIDAGVADTVIHEPGQVLNILDNGTRTVVNGQGKNAGDPDTGGDWNGRAKASGLQIIDTTTGDVWFYHPSLSGGRKKL